MTRIPKRLALAGLLTLFACSDSNNPLSLVDLSYSLQGVVADAITGARLGGDLKLYLIQGPSIRGPSRLITGSGDPLQGEYAFTGIPLSLNDSSNNTYKIVAIMTGYQRFESELNFANDSSTDSSSSTVLLDSHYNFIGNIYLFPIGAQSPDYTITATYNGKPVPGATVMLDPVTGSNATVFTQASSTLPNFTGYAQSLTGVTDANGKFVFLGSTLALGGFYKAQVLPVIFTEPTTSAKIPIGATTAGPTFTAGLGNVDIQLALSDLSVPPTGAPLYVTSASNTALGSLQANGNLVITFNIPVQIPNFDNGYTASAFNPGTKVADGTAGDARLNCSPGPAFCPATGTASKPVTGSLSADGLTLTLAPAYATAPAGTERGLSITYSEGPPAGAPAQITFPLIEPKDYPGQVFFLFTSPGGGATQVKTAAGATISGHVQMTAP